MKHEETMSAYASAKNNIASLCYMINGRDNTIKKLDTVNMVSDTLDDNLNKINDSFKEKEPFTFNQNHSEMATGIQDIGHDIHDGTPHCFGEFLC